MVPPISLCKPFRNSCRLIPWPIEKTHGGNRGLLSTPIKTTAIKAISKFITTYLKIDSSSGSMFLSEKTDIVEIMPPIMTSELATGSWTISLYQVACDRNSSSIFLEKLNVRLSIDAIVYVAALLEPVREVFMEFHWLRLARMAGASPQAMWCIGKGLQRTRRAKPSQPQAGFGWTARVSKAAHDVSASCRVLLLLDRLNPSP